MIWVRSWSLLVWLSNRTSSPSVVVMRFSKIPSARRAPSGSSFSLIVVPLLHSIFRLCSPTSAYVATHFLHTSYVATHHDMTTKGSSTNGYHCTK
ncbi:hypothetical protein B0H65DRAFT_456758 [Neurospora tetraspora]|uniref:Uncharacterized protein n=1 Tax=Neurospora tetraspora TaxID=94610 RepID=A0AAE0JKE5_9PEZI|nr:hypothetical protein B0H65DRAFT_456758 [Neurospora tetraspora]